MTKKGSRSKKPKRSSFLKSLYGGEGESQGEKPAEAVASSEKPSAFSGILNKLSASLPGSRSSSTKPGEDYNAANDEDKTNDTSFPISFSSKSKTASSDTDNKTEDYTGNKDSPSSTWWFVFRVVVVLLLVLVFALHLTGYLDNLTAWFTNTLGPYINPMLVSIGLMQSTPRTETSTNGKQSATGTNSIPQLDQNVGTAPVSTATPMPATPMPATPMPATPMPATPMPTNTYQRPIRQVDNIKPIPIRPDQRQTPLQNTGDSARPPATQPAQYREKESREQERQKSIQKALEYAQKNQQKPPAEDPNRIPGPKSGYCYVGEDRGFRSCIEVGESTKCMSGEIFPTMEVCVNPRLRP
jgi:hypothetical protein